MGKDERIRSSIDNAFSYVGLRFEKYVEADPRHFRRTEAEELLPILGRLRRNWAGSLGLNSIDDSNGKPRNMMVRVEGMS